MTIPRRRRRCLCRAAKFYETDSGNVNCTFEVSLSNSTVDPVTFNFATSNNPVNAAVPGTDFVSKSGNGVIPAGEDSVNVNVGRQG